MLDRNGLRPARFVRSRDGLAVVSSEVGAVDIDPADVVEHGRIGPGQALVLDTALAHVVADGELKQGLAGRRPYAAWLAEHRVWLDLAPPASPSGRRSPARPRSWRRSATPRRTSS